VNHNIRRLGIFFIVFFALILADVPTGTLDTKSGQ